MIISRMIQEERDAEAIQYTATIRNPDGGQQGRTGSGNEMARRIDAVFRQKIEQLYRSGKPAAAVQKPQRSLDVANRVRAANAVGLPGRSRMDRRPDPAGGETGATADRSRLRIL